MSKYEQVVRGFMVERGVESVAELHRHVLAQGCEVSYQRVLRNLKAAWTGRGRDPRLNLAIARALGLSEREKVQMALASMGWL